MQRKAAETTDPPVFSTKTAEGKTIVFVPKELPATVSDELRESLAIILAIIKQLGLKCEFTNNRLSDGGIHFLEAYLNVLRGVYIACMQEQGKLLPIDQLAPGIKTGYNFILWYAFSNAIHINESKEWMAIPKTTVLTTEGDNPWKSGNTVVESIRLHNLCQIFGKICSKNLGKPEKFFKPVEVFIQKNVGKKPVKGLYTAEEFSKVQQDHANRIKEIRSHYEGGIKQLNWPNPPVGTVNEWVKKLNVSSNVTEIETVKNNRIKPLLVTSGKGKKRETIVAKGESLFAKLIEIQGGQTVRTIGNVMWSPLCGLSQRAFTDICIKQACAENKKQPGPLDHAKLLISESKPITQAEADILNCQEAINETVQCYLEVIPDNKEFDSWNRAFPDPN